MRCTPRVQRKVFLGIPPHSDAIEGANCEPRPRLTQGGGLRRWGRVAKTPEAMSKDGRPSGAGSGKAKKKASQKPLVQKIDAPDPLSRAAIKQMVLRIGLP